MKMFIICTFLFFTGVCTGQIVAFDKDIKDFKDDYAVVNCTIISNPKGAKIYWQGSWGHDTVGTSRITSSKNLKLINSIMKTQMENSQLKDSTGVFESNELDIMNRMSRVGWAFLRKEQQPALPLNLFGTELMTIISYYFKRK